MGYMITCVCGFVGSEDDFSISLADECWCPKCEAEFILDTDTETDEDDEEEEAGS